MSLDSWLLPTQLLPARRAIESFMFNMVQPIDPPIRTPLFMLAAGTIAFRCTNSDLAICRAVYDLQSGFEASWAEPWNSWLHAYGTMPALVVGIAGLLGWAVGMCWRTMRPWRREALFLGVLLVVGPGLVVNVLFKDNWGRPRPSEVVEFGGRHEFCHAWEFGSGDRNASFPSGHAAMGFYLIAPAFLFLRRNRRVALSLFCVGGCAGLVIGAARVVVGGHFPSDVFCSAGIVYLCGALLYRIVGLADRGLADRGSGGSGSGRSGSGGSGAWAIHASFDKRPAAARDEAGPQVSRFTSALGASPS